MNAKRCCPKLVAFFHRYIAPVVDAVCRFIDDRPEKPKEPFVPLMTPFEARRNARFWRHAVDMANAHRKQAPRHRGIVTEATASADFYDRQAAEYAETLRKGGWRITTEGRTDFLMSVNPNEPTKLWNPPPAS